MFDRPWGEGDDDIRREQEHDSRPGPLDGWEWCPEHSTWYATGDTCPICRCDGCGDVCPADFGEPCPECDGPDWDLDDVVSLGRAAEWDREFEARARADYPGWLADLYYPGAN